MNNRYMKIFVEVYKSMNMTQAAERLFISQPSVSQAIKEIEEYYGVRLFERYPKKLYPTDEGSLLYTYACQILGLYDEVKEEIQLLSDNVTIKAGTNISAGAVLISKYIDRFHEIFPNIRISVKVTGSAKLKKMLDDHDIDFALMEDLVYDSSLIQEPFYNDRIVFVCSPDNELAGKKSVKISDLTGCDFLLREKGVGVREKFDYMMMLNNITVEPAWESSDAVALINAAKHNYGIAVLPYLLVKSEIDNGSVVELKVKDASLNRNLNIVHHREKIFNKWTNEFINIIREMEK